MQHTVANLLSVISEEDEELAGQYAYELAKEPADPYPVALRLVHGDFSKAAVMVNSWRQDPEFQQALRDAQAAMTKFDRLHTKEDFAIEVQERMKGMSGKVWIEAAKFYADLRGFVKKEEVPTTLIQNVITVPADASFDDWERVAAAAQRKLQDEAKIINGDSTDN